MCSAPQPKPPEVVYQGPSRKEIRQDRRDMRQFRKDSMLQQQEMQTALQAQIDAANAAAAEAAAQLAEQQQAMQAMATTANQTYAVQTTQQAPASPQVTKSQSTATLPRATASLTVGQRNSTNTGLNIGR